MANENAADSGKKPGLKFNAEVNLGHLLIIVTILTSWFARELTIAERRVKVEEKIDLLMKTTDRVEKRIDKIEDMIMTRRMP
jgi:hypothetical protein